MNFQNSNKRQFLFSCIVAFLILLVGCYRYSAKKESRSKSVNHHGIIVRGDIDTNDLRLFNRYIVDSNATYIDVSFDNARDGKKYYVTRIYPAVNNMKVCEAFYLEDLHGIINKVNIQSCVAD